MESILKINNLSFSYPDTQKKVLNDVSFSIVKGSYTAILGTNGSGKTTLSRILYGFLHQQEGSIYPNTQISKEKVYSSKKNTQIPIGIVFQSPKHQIIAGIVNKDIAFGPENIMMPKDLATEKIQQSLNITKLTEKANSKTTELSLGQTQKLALSGILAMNPELLLMDEALSMIDPECRKEILSFLDEVNKQGTTILHITHDKEEALKANHILVLDEGKLIFNGSKESFLQNIEVNNKIFGEYISYTEDNKTANSNLYSAQTALSFNNLSFSYSDTNNLFSNFNLSIKKGTLCAVVGESGSGKSTLFELACGLIKQQQGSINAISKPILALQDAESALFEEFAIDDVAYGPRNNGISGKPLKEKVKYAMDTVGLPFDTYKEKRTFLMSGGEKRKLALAGILALDSDIYFFDEPTAALDPLSRKKILTFFRILCNQGKTIVFSTHRLEETIYADRYIKLDDAKITFDSNPFESKQSLPKIEPTTKINLLNSLRKGIQGSYKKVNSIIHRQKSITKLVIMLSLFILSLVVQPIPYLLGICGISLIYALCAKYSIPKLLIQTLKVLPWIVFILILQILFFPKAQDAQILFTWKFLTLTKEQLYYSLQILVRFFAIMTTICTYSFSTEESENVDALKIILMPLKKLGLPTQRLVLLLMIVLRFIPLLFEETLHIVKIQLIRGGLNKKKGLISSIKSLLPLFVPLILQTLKRAENIADALDARYFH